MPGEPTLTRSKSLLVASLLLQAADGMLTYVGIGLGGAEGNPIVGYVLDSLGVGPGLIAVKGGGCLAFLIIYHSKLWWSLWPIAGIYAGLAVLPWSFLIAGTLLGKEI